MLYHFRERQRLHPAPLGLLSLAAVFEAVLALTRPGNLLVHAMQWTIVAAIVILGLTIREMVIRVGTDDLEFGFGPVRRRVKLSGITHVRIVDSSALPVGSSGKSGGSGTNASPAGIGVHRTPGGYMVWIAQRGPAVEIRVIQSDPRQPAGYIISTSRPHDLVAALQAGQSKRAIETP